MKPKVNGLTFATLAGAKRPARRGPTRILFWSYSRYNQYTRCPLSARLRFLDKIVEPPNKAMQRGSDLGQACEQFLKGTLLKLPVELLNIKPELMRIKKIYASRVKLAVHGHMPVVEETWAWTDQWEETTWNDWERAWLRVKLDAGHWENIGTAKKPQWIYVVTDWKTGKFKIDQNMDYVEQLELYALAVLLKYPHLEEVRPRLVYTDEGIVFPDPKTPLVFTRADIDALKKLWIKRTTPMLRDERFAPRPGGYCNWCHFRKGNAANGGGQCKF